MNANLLSNKELEDYENEDSFDFLIKAEAIRAFLEFNSTSLEKNKMLVLYGDWGSGKTSLMKHIEKKIDKRIYYPIFFHAWEHEKDENLPLSLCDRLIEAASPDADLIKKFVKGAIITLKSFASGITLKTPGFLSGLGLDVELSGENVVKALDEALEKSENPSFYKSNKAFKDSFQKIENLILKKHNAQKILIFVDDLDRCEPESVLNLITALKLFFTYGNKSIYFCGIDKDAVTKAVKTKYKDVIKSEEYMEKVFDISFNMPKTFSLKKILSSHFSSVQIEYDNEFAESTDIISEFFKDIKFTNPRHIKKVLNKYEILKSFKELSALSNEVKKLIPDLITHNKSGRIFETIFCLFMIVLYEFFPDEFRDVEDYGQKMVLYSDIRFNEKVKIGSNPNKSTEAEHVEAFLQIPNIHEASINNILDSSFSTTGNYGFGKFLLIFSHSHPSNIITLRDNEVKKTYHQCFIDNSISTNFCKFLAKNQNLVVYESSYSRYQVSNLFKMVKYLL